MKDQYDTVAQELTVKAVIQRSEFLAHVREVNTEQEAREFISAIKEQHKQATHNCSAFCLGLPPHETVFADDDGEPSGTAGKPILGAIKSSGVTNVVVVVTRYFGGKKLGVRGLIDAYGGVAKDAIQQAGIVTRIITQTFSIKCDYPAINSVMYYLQKYQAKILDSHYAEKVKLTISVRQSQAEQLQDILAQYGQILD